MMRAPQDWPKWAFAGYVSCNCFFSMALLSGVAAWTGSAFIFPSLGPTAYLLFFAPQADSSRPKNVLIGHGIALLCGWAALWATGLLDQPGALEQGVDTSRMLATGISLGATAGLMMLLGVNHAPAGATTLIVSLGILDSITDLGIIFLAVVLLLAYALIVRKMIAALPDPPSRSP